MPLDLAVADYVRQLRRVGLRPGEQLVQHIVQAGAAAVGPLLELALATELLYKKEPECYAPLHALRLLGELRPPEMIAPLLRALPLDTDEDTDLPGDWETEVPQIVGRLGAAAVAPLWAIADDAGFALAGRSAALNALTYATAIDPAIRDEVIAGLRERLARSDDTTFSSYLVVALANLGTAEAYSDVMRRYREGRIDQEIIPAGAARQLLLTSSDKRLACVRHPLWERYDQHGPFPHEHEA